MENTLIQICCWYAKRVRRRGVLCRNAFHIWNFKHGRMFGLLYL